MTVPAKLCGLDLAGKGDLGKDYCILKNKVRGNHSFFSDT